MPAIMDKFNQAFVDFRNKLKDSGFDVDYEIVNTHSFFGSAT